MNKTRTLGFISALALIGTSAVAVAGDTSTQGDAKTPKTTKMPPQKIEGTAGQGQQGNDARANAQKGTAGQGQQGNNAQANAQQGNQIQPKDQVMAVAIDDLEASAVENLQRQLAELGYYKGKIDGKIGPLSRNAIRQYFADQQRLLARNMLGEHTLESLGVDVTDRQLVRGLDHQAVQRQRMGGQDAQDAQKAPADRPEQGAEEGRWQDNQSGDVRDY